jgi:hypothetical protein
LSGSCACPEHIFRVCRSATSRPRAELAMDRVSSVSSSFCSSSSAAAASCLSRPERKGARMGREPRGSGGTRRAAPGLSSVTVRARRLSDAGLQAPKGFDANGIVSTCQRRPRASVRSVTASTGGLRVCRRWSSVATSAVSFLGTMRLLASRRDLPRHGVNARNEGVHRFSSASLLKVAELSDGRDVRASGGARKHRFTVSFAALSNQTTVRQLCAIDALNQWTPGDAGGRPWIGRCGSKTAAA